MEAAMKPNPADVNYEVAASSPALVEQSQGLGRAAVMKGVVGPYLDRILRPVYSPEITNEESSTLLRQDFTCFGSLETFNEAVQSILLQRTDRLLKNNEFTEIEELDSARRYLFYYHRDIYSILREARETSVVVPLTIASQIYRRENGSRNQSGRFFILKNDAVHPADIRKIMERDFFDDVLMHLTKGPNGFLAGASSELNIDRDQFFAFDTPDRTELLRFWDVYQVEDDKVVGLAPLYHLSAHTRRQQRAKSSKLSDNKNHKPMDSSGCPARHKFENPETGEKQEPLVITAKEFLVRVLKIVAESQKETAERCI